MKRGELPKSLFLPVGRSAGVERLPETRGEGYFKSIFSAFLRHRSVRISLFIIVAIALFSLLAPLFISRSERLMDPYYAKLPPRLEGALGSLGVFDGGVERRLGERGLLRLAGIAIATSPGGDEASLGEAIEAPTSPIISLGEPEGRVRRARVDGYLEVGFIYKTVTPDEYEAMLLWQEALGVQLLYPLIAQNAYTGDENDPNIWFKVGRGGMPLDETGDEIEEIGSDTHLYENYLRDERGEPVYAIPSGGGSGEARGVRVRLLYHSYYRFKNGASPSYLLGTDSQGYDLALRVAGGIRVSLLLAISVSLINLLIGAAVGSVEGYFGGAVDLTIERVTDVLSGVPFIVVATLFQIYLADRVGAIPSLLFAFVLTGWLSTASRVRAQFYRFKNSEYVLAAKTMGVSNARIILRHILPNTLGTLITSSALVIPGVIFTESMLSFLGIVNLGSEGITSLGTLLSDAATIWSGYPHLMLVPASVISLLMIAFNMIGNGLRDAQEPGSAGGA
ncbi:MAG: ABC transporter permease [Clostridia bacterium]|nr:ABC transporter permease [Clostridia bacterium]